MTILALIALNAQPALAKDAVELQVMRKAQEGYDAPTLTVVANVSGQVEVSMRCGSKRYALSEAVKPGGTYPLAFEGLSRGHHACSGTLTLQASDGTAGEMPLSLEVDVLPPLELSVTKEDLDIDGHTMSLRASRPLSWVAVEVLDDSGQRIGELVQELSGFDQVELEWDALDEGEVLKIVITARDTDQLAGKLELSPWHYNIPHEDVTFASGQWEVLPKEEPKLEQAWSDLQAVLAKYGSIVEVKLFVAGYTDTVGGAQANLGLSRSRARAIAQWFRSRGFTGPISFQGFGEQVLAVPTPDETAERANRRALYILAADEPPVSDDLPRASWSRLP